jgi:glycosyltransferase involved in cell wall biosynthesis
VSTRVVLLRGHSVAPWDLRPHELLGPDYRVSALLPRRNLYGTDGLDIDLVPVRSVSDLVPAGVPARLFAKAVGERFLGLERALRGADIVHVAELGNWYSAQAADLKAKLGFRLAVTAWETLPLRAAYRNVRTRPYARRVLAAGDVFLAATDRTREALLLEGVEPGRVTVCAPGVDLERFAIARRPQPPRDGSHLILSAGRLVWEKGHQDLLRAVALLRRQGRSEVRVVIVGDGPERARLQALAGDLGLERNVSFQPAVPYAEMPSLYAQASCLVLASLPVRHWEEQFGMVLAEAMAGALPIVCSTSGAIPEVAGPNARYFAPGDWVGLARTLEKGPLAMAPGTRAALDEDRIERFSTAAAARRLRDVYERLLPVMG